MKRIFLILFLISALLFTACGRWYEQRIAGGYNRAFRGDYLLHDAVTGSGDLVLHLHGLDDDEDLQ